MNMKKVCVKVEINAPIEKVWEVLTNIKGYSEWNPFVYNVSSDKIVPDVGYNMLFSVCFSNGKKVQSKEYVMTFTPPQLTDNTSALWVYRFDGLLHKMNIVRATRTQTLKALSMSTTEYSSEEVFSGLGKCFLPLKEVQKGFTLQANALKVFCELK